MDNFSGSDYGNIGDDIVDTDISKDTATDFGDDLPEDTAGADIPEDTATDFGDDLPEDTIGADIPEDTVTDLGDDLPEDTAGADIPEDTVTDLGDDLPEDTIGADIPEDTATDFDDDMSEGTLETDKSPVKMLKRDELELIRACDNAVNQRLDIQADEYRSNGMSETEIQERLAVDKWNFQRESLEDAFPGQNVSPNIFNGLTENGTRERIADINSSEELRRQVRLDSKSDIGIEEASAELSDSGDMLMRDVVEQNVAHQKLPGSDRAYWSNPDSPGDGVCHLRDDAILNYSEKSDGTKVSCTGAEFKKHMREQYGQDYVEYSHREPDFSPFEQAFTVDDFNAFLGEKYGDNAVLIGAEHQDHPGHVHVDRMGIDRNDTYSQAVGQIRDALGVPERDIYDYMKSRNLTWHECGDRKTIRAIPTEINQVFTHTGGIGVEKDVRALQEHIREVTDGRKLDLQRTNPEGTSTNATQAIKGLRARLKSIKRRISRKG